MSQHNIKTPLRFGIILVLVLTQITFAKSKTDFDIGRFRAQVKQDEVTYIAPNGKKVIERETPSAFIQKEFDAAGNSIYQREFSKDGKLTKEGRLSKVAAQEIPVGEWKTYDEQGKVIETNNTEEGFQFRYDDLLEVCKKRNIDLADRLSTLIKSKPGERPMWIVGWNSISSRSETTSKNDRSPTTRMELIVVDGMTGEVRESTPYVPFKAPH